MNNIQLQKKPDMDVTLVRNVFLDEYMPEASGEFVKIYLYLLRCASGEKEISMGRIADIFEHTEKDVTRALKYWEKMQLLSLSYDNEGNLTGIDFLEPSPKAAVLPEKPAFVAPPKVPLSPDRIAELKSHDDMEQLLFIAARYIGRPLTSTEIGNILYYYDSLHFSTDLIEYLVEYCVSKGNKSCHYMEKVALGWAEEGITSVQEAKNSTNLYHKKYYSVLNAFGIKGRGPARTEKEYIDRWTDTFHFTLDIIEDLKKLKSAISLKMLHSDSWEQFKIQDIASIGRGRVISSVEISQQENPLYPVYSSQTSNDGIMGYLDDFMFEGEYISWTTDGANAGTVFYRNGKFNCTNVCGLLKLKKGFDAHFVSLVLAEATRMYVSTNLANPKLMNNTMGNIQIRLPKLEEQKRISVVFRKLHGLLETHNSLIIKYSKQKQYLLSQMFI